jgi:hypothetical protein
MKKIIGILSFAMLINFNATSQSFEIGDNMLGLGIGIGGNYGYGSLTGSPSIGLYYENGVTEIGTVGILGIGGYVGYKSYKDEYSYFGYSAKYSYKFITVGARGAFHYTGLDVEKFDPYAGLMLGYNIASSTVKETGTASIFSNSNYNDASGSVNFSGFVGARYFLTDNVAAFAELGFGVSYLTIGAAYKF